jgi:hypothetical protein
MTAILSPCRAHRMRLDREVSNAGLVAALIGVNPSVADATTNDPTIRKDIGFARRLGWRRVIKANKFTYRATDVRELASCAAPNHPDADDALRGIFADADVLVPCWGPLAKLPKRLRDRWIEVTAMMAEAGKPVMCFGTARDGQPRHTLMLAYTTPLVPWMFA